MPKITHERLLEAVSYEPDTGIFRWLIRPSNNVHIGDRVGAVSVVTGHRFMSIDGERLQATRLAWFYVHGKWPEGDLICKDENRDNAAIDNLTEMSRVASSRLRVALANNTSGYKGVSRSVPGRWQASITWNYKQVGLGRRFETAEEAAEVYNEAEMRLRLAKNIEDGNTILQQVILWRKQRAAWKNLQRQNIELAWTSFEEFCLEVIDFPPTRFAIGPIDAAKAIGPGNWKWSTDHGISAATDRVAYNRAQRLENQDFMRGKDFKKKYGIDWAEYQRKLVEQGGACACCGGDEVKQRGGNIQLLSVDHHHTTGAVRGLLCSSCNMAVGYLRDDPAIARKAADYLEKYTSEAPSLPTDNPD